MDKVIQFNKGNSNNMDDAECIFWCDFKRDDGTVARVDLMKHRESNEIGIGITKNFIDDDSEMFSPDEIIVLCEDEDSFIIDKLREVIK